MIPNFDGDPNGLVAWFICEHYGAREEFDLQASTEALKDKMRSAEFPQRAIETLWTGVTSQTEIRRAAVGRKESERGPLMTADTVFSVVQIFSVPCRNFLSFLSHLRGSNRKCGFFLWHGSCS